MIICGVIFVSEEVEKAIGEPYKRCNPIASYVRPHLTLLFPLETELQSSEVCAHLESVTSQIDMFDIGLDGVRLRPEDLLIYLGVSEGAEELHSLYRELYEGHFKRFLDPTRAFYPHLTVGRFETEAEMSSAYDELRGFRPELSFVARRLSLLERKAPHRWEAIRNFDFGRIES
jgi:2'-5' RNA ligase